MKEEEEWKGISQGFNVSRIESLGNGGTFKRQSAADYASANAEAYEQRVRGATNTSRAHSAEVDRNKCVLRPKDMQRAGVRVKVGATNLFLFG